MNLSNNIPKKYVKKYPIIYEDKEYEIRIEEHNIICIYKITKYKTFFKNEKIKYEKIFEIPIKELILDIVPYNNFYGFIEEKAKDVDPSSDNYYIQLFTKAFKKYMEKEKASKKLEESIENTKKLRLAALEEWDGIIL